MIGSRYRRVLSIARVSLSTCASETSRWNGVGSTFSTGSATKSRAWPPSGSRYAASTAPPSSSTCRASACSSAGGSARRNCPGPSSVGLSFTPLRARGRPVLVWGRCRGIRTSYLPHPRIAWLHRGVHRFLALLPLVCGCLVAHEEPAVRGLPRDDRAAPLSAVWVGHATVLLRIGNRTVLTDPNLGGAILTMPRETPASLRPSELPRVDVAVISHMHMDHFDAATVRKLGRYTAVFFPDGGQAYADEILQPRKRPLKTWDSVEISGLTITAVPARVLRRRHRLRPAHVPGDRRPVPRDRPRVHPHRSGASGAQERSVGPCQSGGGPGHLPRCRRRRDGAHPLRGVLQPRIGSRRPAPAAPGRSGASRAVEPRVRAAYRRADRAGRRRSADPRRGRPASRRPLTPAMSSLPEYDRLDATDLAAMVRRKEVSPPELVEAAIERVEARNPPLNAVVGRCYERARQQARGALPEGPFRGVPFLLKDMLAVDGGICTSNACRFFQGFAPQRDSELVRRLKSAGLVIVGKTNTSEMGILPVTEPRLYGPTRNPWNTAFTPGGSSGGSAAAVAAGMVPMAHGGDGG